MFIKLNERNLNLKLYQAFLVGQHNKTTLDLDKKERKIVGTIHMSVDETRNGVETLFWGEGIVIRILFRILMNHQLKQMF